MGYDLNIQTTYVPCITYLLHNIELHINYVILKNDFSRNTLQSIKFYGYDKYYFLQAFVKIKVENFEKF